MKWTVRLTGSKGQYLRRNGTWGPYRDAARCASAKAADKLAVKFGVKVFGLFPRKAVGD
jgi:hypothetical protein